MIFETISVWEKNMTWVYAGIAIVAVIALVWWVKSRKNGSSQGSEATDESAYSEEDKQA